MDTAVLRGVKESPLTLGDNVLVGPRAYLMGCTVEDEVFLATGSTVFNGAHIGRGAKVRIDGIVHLRSVLPPNETVPLGWIAVGDPAKILPPEAHEEIWSIQKPLDFPRFVSLGSEKIICEMVNNYSATNDKCTLKIANGGKSLGGQEVPQYLFQD